MIIGAAMAGGRQVGEASPTLAHGFAAALAGVTGAAAASPLAALLAGLMTRSWRVLLPGMVAAGVAALVVALLLGT